MNQQKLNMLRHLSGMFVLEDIQFKVILRWFAVSGMTTSRKEFGIMRRMIREERAKLGMIS